MATQDCTRGVCGPRNEEGHIPRPEIDPLILTGADIPLSGPHNLVVINGEGSFISAVISKRGGETDNTIVKVKIDGRPVVNWRFKDLQTMGLTKVTNPYGVVLHKGEDDVKTMTIGFPSPLSFATKLEIKVDVQENNVCRIVANAIWALEGAGEEIQDSDPIPPS